MVRTRYDDTARARARVSLAVATTIPYRYYQSFLNCYLQPNVDSYTRVWC